MYSSCIFVRIATSTIVSEETNFEHIRYQVSMVLYDVKDVVISYRSNRKGIPVCLRSCTINFFPMVLRPDDGVDDVLA